MKRLIKFFNNISHFKFFILLLMIFIVNFFIYWNLYSEDEIGGDSGFYHKVGENLSKDNDYVFQGKLVMTREPGYPFFISLIYRIFGVNPNIVKIVQFFIFYFSVILLYSILIEIISKTVARFTSLLTSIYPIFSFFAIHIVSETLAIFFLFLFLYFFLKALKTKMLLYYFISSLLFCFFIMTKNMYLFLFPFFMVFILFYRDVSLRVRLIRFFVFIFCFFIVIAPWMIRNYINFRDPMLSTRSGAILYGHAVKTEFNNKELFKFILSSVSGEYFVRRFVDMDYNFTKNGLGDNYIKKERKKIIEKIGLDNYDDIDREVRKRAIILLKKHPIKYFFLGFIELNNLNSPIIYYERHFSIFHDNIYNKTIIKSLIIIILRLMWYLFLFFVIYGIITSIKNRNKYVYPLILIIIYTNIIIFCLQGIPRFITPILPFYFAFAFYFLQRLVSMNKFAYMLGYK